MCWLLPHLDRFCPAEQSGQVDWPQTVAGGTVAGTCAPGFSGSPSRSCTLNGDWEAIVHPCEQITCAAVTDGFTDWPETNAFATAHGSCAAGFLGNPTRVCDGSGAWESIQDPCTPIYCPAGSAANADWDATRAGETALGACIDGYEGTPTRVCLISGLWHENITNPCTIHYDNCPAGSVGMTFFPPAAPGTTVGGNCPDGFRETIAGPPLRYCHLNGTWEAEFSNPCELIPVESIGNIANLTAVSKTSVSVVLSWTGVNITANSTFRVEVAMGTTAFVIANIGSAIGITEQEYEVLNLFANTVYQFRVCVGDDLKGYNELAAAVIAVKTYIPRTIFARDLFLFD